MVLLAPLPWYWMITTWLQGFHISCQPPGLSWQQPPGLPKEISSLESPQYLPQGHLQVSFGVLKNPGTTS